MSYIFGRRLSEDMPHKKAQIAAEINSLSERELNAKPPLELVNPILEDLGFGKVGEITDQISRSVSDLDASVELFVRIVGDLCILQYEPSRYTRRKLDHVVIKNGKLVFSYDRDQLPLNGTIRQQFDQDLQVIRAAIPTLQQDIKPFRQELESYALQMISRKKRSQSTKDAALDGLDFPDAVD